MDKQLIDQKSFIIGGLTLVGGFLLFYNDSAEFFSSLAAASMAAALVWGAYIVVRWIYLAIAS